MALRRSLPATAAMARALAAGQGGTCAAGGGGTAAGGLALAGGGSARRRAPDAASPPSSTRGFAASAQQPPPSKPRFLVTGAGGQIGVELCRELVAEHGPDAVVPTDARPRAGVASLDVTDAKAVDAGELE
jgi:hypothetical protein